MIHLISQCTYRLDFKPVKPWPLALPAFCWGDLLLTAFDRSPESPVVDLARLNLNSANPNAISETSRLENAIHACYPDLSTAELSRLYYVIQDVPDNLKIEMKQLFRLYGYHWSSVTEGILKCLGQTPPEFQMWTSLKAIQPRDLEPLLAVDQLADFAQVFERLVELNPSKSVGCQMIEWLIELNQLGFELEELFTWSKNGLEDWVSNLQSHRYPETYLLDQKKRLLVKQLTWPPQVQSTWKRSGDRGLIEVHLNIKNPEDFEDKLMRLQNTLRELKQKNPWSRELK